MVTRWCLKGLPSSALSGLNVGSISGVNTFNNLNFGPGWTKDDIIELGGDQSVNGTFQALGASPTSRTAVTSTTTTARTITAAIVSCNHADFSYITGAGSGNWNLSANDSIDYASNTGITFTWPWNNTENIYWTGLQDNVAGSGYWTGRLGWVNNFTGNDYEWSNTSGGSGGGMPRHYQPGSTNNVFFNANSGFTIGNQTVMWAPGSDSWVEYVNNLDFTGSDAVAGPIWSDASGNYYPKFQVQGNLTLCAGITFTGSSDGFVLGGGAGTHTFTTGNANLGGGWPSWQINNTGGGKWVISGDVNYPVGWTWIAGTIDGYTNHTNFYLPNGNFTFGGGGGHYGTVNWNGGGALTLNGANTIDTLWCQGTMVYTDAVKFAANQSIGTLKLHGYDITRRLQVGSTVYGTQRQITTTIANDIVDSDISDIAGVGAASWNISAGNNSDFGDNLGIIFSTGYYQYWVGNSGNWSDAAHWASTTGGASGSGRVPLIQDIAMFDVNSFSIPGRTVTIDITNLGGIDTSTVTNNPTITKSGTVDIYGGINLGSPGGCVYTVTSTYLMGSNTIPVTRNGVYTFTTNLYVQTNPAYMTSVNFNSDFTLAGTLYLVSGTLCLQGFNVTAQYFDSSTTTYARGSKLEHGNLYA